MRFSAVRGDNPSRSVCGPGTSEARSILSRTSPLVPTLLSMSPSSAWPCPCRDNWPFPHGWLAPESKFLHIVPPLGMALLPRRRAPHRQPRGPAETAPSLRTPSPVPERITSGKQAITALTTVLSHGAVWPRLSAPACTPVRQKPIAAICALILHATNLTL
jgi:hypothetical protein